jgi:hypothetical protein
MKKLLLIALGAHSALIILFGGTDVNAKESWSWFFPFIFDLPISIFFQQVIPFLKEEASAAGLTQHNSVLVECWLWFSHLVLGGAWWVTLVYLCNRLIRIAGKSGLKGPG